MFPKPTDFLELPPFQFSGPSPLIYLVSKLRWKLPSQGQDKTPLVLSPNKCLLLVLSAPKYGYYRIIMS